jgi:hypothetical protein
VFEQNFEIPQGYGKSSAIVKVIFYRFSRLNS